jgi:uncharacterized protein YjbJ (UPF0337 family)
MSWDQIQGNWPASMGIVKQKWSDLTDDELEMAAGQREQLAYLLLKKYGYGKDRAEKELHEFVAALG